MTQAMLTSLSGGSAVGAIQEKHMTDISKASETLEASLEYIRSLEDLDIAPEIVLTINCGSATTVLQGNTTADRMSVLLGFAQADLQPTLREVA